ncbi:hypothetical protein MEO43_27045, partial [Dolichospermum sp. ST_sed5]|nr:hypothetical protein [Dolichospermum sp. ST_sed5]
LPTISWFWWAMPTLQYSISIFLLLTNVITGISIAGIDIAHDILVLVGNAHPTILYIYFFTIN